MIKKELGLEVEGFVRGYRDRRHTVTSWERPLVGFASASDPMFRTLQSVVSPKHALPTDLLKEAVTVVAFFLPFTREMARTNTEGREASREWAEAYVETNELIGALSVHLRAFLGAEKYKVQVMPATHNFDSEKLISHWSHRHVAFVAGLGRFGLNNMLVTDRGCCGRIGTFVTSAPIDPDIRKTKESCLYRYNGFCRKCVERCVNSALGADAFDRYRCHEMCLHNAARFRSLGKADVCGKCMVGVPCAHEDPVSRILQTAG